MIENSAKGSWFYTDENKAKMQKDITRIEEELKDGLKGLDPEGVLLMKNDVANLRILLDLQKIGVEENNPAMGLVGNLGYDLYLLILTVNIVLHGFADMNDSDKRKLLDYSAGAMTRMANELIEWKKVLTDVLGFSKGGD